MKQIPLSEIHFDRRLSEATLDVRPHDAEKTDFYTEGGVVHPIRDSEGYDSDIGDAPRSSSTGTEYRTATQSSTGAGSLAYHFYWGHGSTEAGWRQCEQCAAMRAGEDRALATVRPAPMSSGAHLTDDQVKAAAEVIARNRAAFFAAGGTVDTLLGNDAKVTEEKAKATQTIEEMAHNGVVNRNDMGVDFTRVALGFENVVVATDTATEAVAGAQGYRSGPTFGETKSYWGASQFIGNGYLGTTGILEGAGSAVASEFIHQAAIDDAAAIIHPVSSAEGFWSKMGMTPSSYRSSEWGMSPVDAKKVWAAVSSASKSEKAEEPYAPEQWDPDAAPNRDKYLKWIGSDVTTPRAGPQEATPEPKPAATREGP